MFGSAGFEAKVARAKKDCEARFLEERCRLGLEGLVLLVAKVEGGGHRSWGQVSFQKELLAASEWRSLGAGPARGKKKLRAKRPVQEVLDSLEWYEVQKGRVAYKALQLGESV